MTSGLPTPVPIFPRINANAVPQCALAHFISVASSYLHSFIKKRKYLIGTSFYLVDGNFLSSHTVSHAIFSAFVSLTFVFDMGTSGSSQLLSPPWLIVFEYNHNYIFLSAKYFAFAPNLGDQALDLLVSVRYMHCCTSTPDLSTS